VKASFVEFQKLGEIKSPYPQTLLENSHWVPAGFRIQTPFTAGSSKRPENEVDLSGTFLGDLVVFQGNFEEPDIFVIYMGG